MSYEGFEEYLCKQGHYTTTDCREAMPTACVVCGEPMTHRHSVDQTNGYNEEHEGTCRAPKQEIGFTDIWKEDHYGTRYATKALQYQPHPRIWIDIEAERRAEEERHRLNEENRRWSIQLLDEQGRVWKILNEFDPEEPHVFKFLNHEESDDVSLVHAFTSQEAAETALQAIVGELSRVADFTGGFMPFAEVFWFDLRTY